MKLWIELIRTAFQWQAFVNTVMNFRVLYCVVRLCRLSYRQHRWMNYKQISKISGDFLIISATRSINFSRNISSHGLIIDTKCGRKPHVIELVNFLLLKINVFRDAALCREILTFWRNLLHLSPSLNIEAARFSETSVSFYQTTQFHIPWGSNLHIHRRENPNSQT
jgi:hypothetical protein